MSTSTISTMISLLRGRLRSLERFARQVPHRHRSSTNPAIRSEDVPKLGIILGGGGLLPFFWYSLQHAPTSEPSGQAAPWGDEVLDKWSRFSGVDLTWAKSGDQATVRHHLVTYGACILSFLGAVHWGVAMVAPLPGVAGAQYVYSVLPSLMGWGACIVDKRTQHSTIAPQVMLSSAFLGAYMFDEWALTKKAVPAWFTHLRTPLTVCVAGLLVTAGYMGREPSQADKMKK